MTDDTKSKKQVSDESLDFRAMFMSLDTAYIVFDAEKEDCTILEQNQAHADMAMVDRSDVIGKPLLEAFPDNSEEYRTTGRSAIVESVRKVAKTAKTDILPVFRYDIKDYDGVVQTKYWEISHAPLFKEDRVVAVVQQSKDITDSFIAKRDLVQAQEQLAQTLAYSAVGTWLWDIKSDVVKADKNSAKMLGLGDGGSDFEGPIGDFIESIHPDDVDRVQNEIQQALEGGTTYECEYRTTGLDGHEYWLLARGHVVKDRADKPTSFPGLIVDITDRKHTEQQLHVLAEANTQFPASIGYRQTLEAIASIIVPDVADWCSIDLLEGDSIQQVAIAHKDPSKLEWASQLRQDFGLVDMDAPNGTPWVIRTGKIEHVPEITDDMLQAAATSKQQLKLLREVGMTSAIIAPLKIDGQTIGAISFISTDRQRRYDETDIDIIKGLANRASLAVYNANLFREAEKEISERKKLHKELEELNVALESRVADRTELLQKTNAGLKREIQRRQSAEAEMKEYSAELARSNQELQDFAYVASHDLQEPLRKIRAFGDILESEYSASLGDGSEYLARMQSAAARMSTLIQDLLALSRVSTREQSSKEVDLTAIAQNVVVDLEWRIQELDAKVSIDKLPTICADETHMRQIFHNLIGNALKFNRPAVAPVISVYQAESSDPEMYEIHVKDNGIGFDERYLDRIFSVFQRLHGKDEYEGTGIGLAVVRKIAERYGGTITASSKKNHGSTFILTIPKSIEEQQDD